MPSLPPSVENWPQCGQVIDAYSTSFTGALGLPMMKPRSVAVTVCVQSASAGAATFAIGAAGAGGLGDRGGGRRDATIGSIVAAAATAGREGQDERGAAGQGQVLHFFLSPI